MKGAFSDECATSYYPKLTQFSILKNGIYKFVTPLDLAQLNKHSECVRYLQDHGAFRGYEIVRFAARKIQWWWRSHRVPKLILEPIEEYDDDSLEGTTPEIRERFV